MARPHSFVHALQLARAPFSERRQAMEENTSASEGALLDLAGKSDEELRELLDQLYVEEQKVSYRRRLLHGKIDILRAELVRRMASTGEGVEAPPAIDVERLIEILSNDLRGVSRVDVTDEDEDSSEE